MLPLQLKSACEKILGEKLPTPVVIDDFHNVGGGCINETGKIQTNQGDFFIKWNQTAAYPAMFEMEAKGLELLNSAESIKFPRVIATGSNENIAFLILELIQPGKRKMDFFENFGTSLAAIHRHSNQQFGLEYDNYIGSIPQSNTRHRDWNSFFIEERLQKQIRLARDKKAISSKHIQHFEKLFHRLPEIFPQENPALIHGDLWNGNFMTGNDGCVCLIDPAAHYGNREAELSMTKLFGGFDEKFYQSYDRAFPLEKEFLHRVDIYNLYPLMVHVNLFGGGYLSSVESILKKF